MSYLPAPYESVRSDDLGAALGAGLTVSLAGITSWILGHFAVSGIRQLIDLGKAGQGADLPQNVLVPTAGWTAAAVLMVLGGLLLVFRRGLGALVLGAVLAIGTTALAQYKFQFGTMSHPVAQWPLYWGGAAVLIAALLPATRRWSRRRATRSGGPDGQQRVATLWPGT